MTSAGLRRIRGLLGELLLELELLENEEAGRGRLEGQTTIDDFTRLVEPGDDPTTIPLEER